MNLSDTKLIGYRTYQISAYRISNLSDTNHIRYRTYLIGTGLIGTDCFLLSEAGGGGEERERTMWWRAWKRWWLSKAATGGSRLGLTCFVASFATGHPRSTVLSPSPTRFPARMVMVLDTREKGGGARRRSDRPGVSWQPRGKWRGWG
jgi:hypothetical protein